MPGLGLSGLFVLLSALSLPLARRGSGSRAAVARLFRLAVIMAAAIVLTWELIVEAVTALHRARPVPARSPSGGVASPASPGFWHLPGIGSWHLPIMAVSLAIIVLLVALAEVLLQLVGAKPTPTPPPVEPALPIDALLSWPAPAPPGRANQARISHYRGEHRVR